ncbi:MAG: aminopeptidase P family protein, partial [Bryobacterales bacterium]|nr:aminopeptidase P family protein [Bryobacterales bacterium]
MMLELENCRRRQGRLLAAMQAEQLDLAVLCNPKTIYYFTGALLDPARPQAFVLKAGGASLLVSNAEPCRHAAGRLEVYTGYSLERTFGRITWNREMVELVAGFAAHGGPAAVEFEWAPAGLLAGLRVEPVNVTPLIDRLRRRKDPDEIECLRAAIALTEAGYAAVKNRLEPGMTECDAYLLIAGAAARHAGTSVEVPGDYACGLRGIGGGGPPTTRKVEAGDLYIFDLFPTVEGYRCDLCRTFSVSAPTALQQAAWEHVVEAHRIAQRVIRPGVEGRAVYREIRLHLERFEAARGSFNHHAGHGVGLDA